MEKCSNALSFVGSVRREVEKELLPCIRKLGMRFYAYNAVSAAWINVPRKCILYRRILRVIVEWKIRNCIYLSRLSSLS